MEVLLRVYVLYVAHAISYVQLLQIGDRIPQWIPVHLCTQTKYELKRKYLNATCQEIQLPTKQNKMWITREESQTEGHIFKALENSRFLEKQTVIQLVNRFSTFYRNSSLSYSQEHHLPLETHQNKWKWLNFANEITWGSSNKFLFTFVFGLPNMFQNSRVRFLAGAGNFSLHHCVQNGSGAHPASYPMSTRGSFPGVKQLMC
jgi:hypothetical protein